MGKRWNLCRDHPTYGGSHRPDGDCKRCAQVYADRHASDAVERASAPRHVRATRAIGACPVHRHYLGTDKPETGCATCWQAWRDKHPTTKKPPVEVEPVPSILNGATSVVESVRAMIARRDELTIQIVHGRKAIAVMEEEQARIWAEVEDLRALFGVAPVEEKVSRQRLCPSDAKAGLEQIGLVVGKPVKAEAPKKSWRSDDGEVVWAPSKAADLSSDYLGSSLGGNHRE